MAVVVTLELTDEVARRAQEAARRTGRALEAVLVDWLEQAAVRDEPALLRPDTAYPLFTPYGNEAAAQVLLDALTAAEAKERRAAGNR